MIQMQIKFFYRYMKLCMTIKNIYIFIMLLLAIIIDFILIFYINFCASRTYFLNFDNIIIYVKNQTKSNLLLQV
jgi:hypothetical protein